MATLPHGTPVIVLAKLKRKYKPGATLYDKNKKYWDVEDFKAPKPGIMIGYRTLANGRIEWGDGEEPTVFIRQENIRAALVSFDSKTNPVYVPLDKMIVP